MKKITIVTPENIEIQYTLAGLGSRTAAMFFDMLIQTLFFGIIAGIMLSIYFNFQEFWENHYGWILGISIFLVAFINYGYYIISELKMNGRTFGKKRMKIRAIRTNGQSVTLKHSVIRNLFKVFIDFYGIGAVLMFLTKENRRAGDFVASTVVVIEESETEPVTLKGLLNETDDYEAALNNEERELIREYLKRKLVMDDYGYLRQCLRHYFGNKFAKTGELEKYKSFIDNL